MRRFAAILIVVPGLLAQQPRFESASELVVVDVAVRQRDGAPVDGLKKGDFAVMEDGKPQTISVFEFQRLTLEPLPPRTPAPRVMPGPKPERRTNQPPERYRDRRLLILFFDFSAMRPEEQIRAQQAALRFLDRHMTAADLVSVMTFSTRLRTLVEFTDDRERLADVIRGFRVGNISDLSVETQDVDEETAENIRAVFTADETEFNIFNTDRKLSAMESAVRGLGALPEKKALIYFSSGITKTGVENHSQLLATVNAAVRANVAFYPVDAGGLKALVPGGEASRAAPGGSGIFSGRAQRQQQERFNDQQETLSTLADDTGGKALLDSNDLALGIVQAQKDVGSYYIIGYYSTNRQRDGRFRRVRVSLAGRSEAKLDYRSGYFAPKDFERFTTVDKERQLEESLLLGDPVMDLPLALEVDFFRVGGNRYLVPVSVKIPGSSVSLAHKGANQQTEFDFIGQVRDEKNRLVGSVRDGIKVKLDEAGAAQLERRQFGYDTVFTLPPGTYKLKFLARENLTGKMGTFETRFAIPDLGAETEALRISSVVWSSQREPLAAAVGSAEKKRSVLDSHPLVQEGQKLVPNIPRVFRKDQNLYVYLEVYDPTLDAQQKTPAVTATLSFFSGSTKAFESSPIRATQLAASRRTVLPVQVQLPFAALTPGRYTCQVNVVDEVGGKFAFSRAHLVLLP